LKEAEMIKRILPLALLAAIAILTIGATCTVPSLTVPSICF
jgi:hypothetical protein